MQPSKKRCQYVIIKYYVRCKEINFQKYYLEYEKIIFKCILDNLFKYRVIFKILIKYYTWKILSIQPNFWSQKFTIEKSIISIKCVFIGYKVLFHLKFHYELNQIKYFWWGRKSWTRKYCKYSIKELRKDILKVLSQLKGSTIL